MRDEEIPCPVDGCDQVFPDEAAAAAHMKAEHRGLFSAPEQIVTETSGENLINIEVPASSEPEDLPILHENLDMEALLKLMDARIDTRVNRALVAERPRIAAAVKTAIEQVVVQARSAGIPIPAVTGTPGGGGVVPGSPVTPAGEDLLKMIFSSGRGTQMEELAKTLTQARAISDVLNPPSIWDRVMQNAVLRSLSKAGLVTEAEVKELTEPPAKP